VYPMTSSLLEEILDNSNPHSSTTLWTGMVRSVSLTPVASPPNKQKFSGGFRGVSGRGSEVTEFAEFDVVRDEIRRWSSLSEHE
jgi:hypothetical protein